MALAHRRKSSGRRRRGRSNDRSRVERRGRARNRRKEGESGETRKKECRVDRIGPKVDFVECSRVLRAFEKVNRRLRRRTAFRAERVDGGVEMGLEIVEKPAKARTQLAKRRTPVTREGSLRHIN